MLYLQNSVILSEISSLLLLLSPNICSFSHTNAGIIEKIENNIGVANKKKIELVMHMQTFASIQEWKSE